MTAPAVAAYSKDNPFAPGGSRYSADNPFAPKPASAEPERPQVGMAEGLVGSAGQGATLGASDELLAGLEAFGPSGLAQSLVAGRNPLDRYREGRDKLRERQGSFEKDHGTAAGLAEFAGGVAPAVAAGGLTRGLSAARAGMAFGGLSALGHGEGDAQDQAQGVAGGVVGGGALGGALGLAGKLAMKTGIPQRLADILPGGARRQAVRSAATLVDPAEAAPKIAAREALAPGQAVIGETSPEAAQLGKVLGRSPKAAITGPKAGWERVKEVTKARRATGKEYDAFEQPLQLDDEITALMQRAGVELPTPTVDNAVPFSVIHRMRHEVSKAARRAAGMSKNELLELRSGIDEWLQARVEGLDKVDADYSTLSSHLSDALNSFKAQRKGAVLGAVREAGSNARGADRPLGFWHQVNQMLKPSPAKAGEAMEDLIFNPANTAQSLADIGKARASILGGGQPVAAPLGAGLGQLAGMAAAPQLNPNAAQAREQALQLRLSGASDDAVAQQLGAVYTPEVVKFVIAATPRRVPQ